MNRSIFGLVALTLVACISQPIHADEFEDALVAELPDLGPIIQQESVDVDEKLRGLQPSEKAEQDDFIIPVKQREPVDADQELQNHAAQTAETKQPATSTWRKVIPLRVYSEKAETEPASND